MNNRPRGDLRFLEIQVFLFILLKKLLLHLLSITLIILVSMPFKESYRSLCWPAVEYHVYYVYIPLLCLIFSPHFATSLFLPRAILPFPRWSRLKHYGHLISGLT